MWKPLESHAVLCYATRGMGHQVAAVPERAVLLRAGAMLLHGDRLPDTIGGGFADCVPADHRSVGHDPGGLEGGGA